MPPHSELYDLVHSTQGIRLLNWDDSPEDDMTVSSSNPDDSPPPREAMPATNNPEILRLYQIIEFVRDTYLMHADYSTESETSRTYTRPFSYLPPTPRPPENEDGASSSDENLESKRIWLWQQWTYRINAAIKKIVYFCKSLPGFFDQHKDDQMRLIKYGLFEVWLVGAASQVTEFRLLFIDGAFISEQQMAIVFGAEFATLFYHFANTLNTLSLNDTEIGLLAGIVLFSQRRDLDGPEIVEASRELLLKALRLLLSIRHPDEPEIETTLMQKISELEVLGVKYHSQLEWYHNNWHRITIPALFSEVFDIPHVQLLEETPDH
uniref:NR LBD domain-containing protein n=1 Tax=Homalodisca liturata TaxID=320908 RepID=A0A1B6K2H5_9HEMI